eukprot:366000-Chlamydomonas_euryale.AAC.25
METGSLFACLWVGDDEGVPKGARTCCNIRCMQGGSEVCETPSNAIASPSSKSLIGMRCETHQCVRLKAIASHRVCWAPPARRAARCEQLLLQR